MDHSDDYRDSRVGLKGLVVGLAALLTSAGGYALERWHCTQADCHAVGDDLQRAAEGEIEPARFLEVLALLRGKGCDESAYRSVLEGAARTIIGQLTVTSPVRASDFFGELARAYLLPGRSTGLPALDTALASRTWALIMKISIDKRDVTDVALSFNRGQGAVSLPHGQVPAGVVERDHQMLAVVEPLSALEAWSLRRNVVGVVGLTPLIVYNDGGLGHHVCIDQRQNCQTQDGGSRKILGDRGTLFVDTVATAPGDRKASSISVRPYPGQAYLRLRSEPNSTNPHSVVGRVRRGSVVQPQGSVTSALGSRWYDLPCGGPVQCFGSATHHLIPSLQTDAPAWDE